MKFFPGTAKAVIKSLLLMFRNKSFCWVIVMTGMNSIFHPNMFSSSAFIFGYVFERCIAVFSRGGSYWMTISEEICFLKGTAPESKNDTVIIRRRYRIFFIIGVNKL